jgi:hypothetical protein
MERVLTRHQGLLIMVGGNIIMSLCVLPQLFGLPPDRRASVLFRQQAA